MNTMLARQQRPLFSGNTLPLLVRYEDMDSGDKLEALRKAAGFKSQRILEQYTERLANEIGYPKAVITQGILSSLERNDGHERKQDIRDLSAGRFLMYLSALGLSPQELAQHLDIALPGIYGKPAVSDIENHSGAIELVHVDSENSSTVKVPSRYLGSRAESFDNVRFIPTHNLSVHGNAQAVAGGYTHLLLDISNSKLPIKLIDLNNQMQVNRETPTNSRVIAGVFAGFSFSEFN